MRLSPEARKQQILGGATQIFAEKGFASAQIADVAKQVGIGHGTVYRYFADKTDLFREVLVQAVSRVGALLEQEQPNADTLEAYEAQVTRIARRLFELAIEEEAVARLIFEEASAVREIAAEYQLALDAFAEMTGEYLVNGQNKGFVRDDVDPVLAGHAINAMIFEGARQVLRAPDRNASLVRWTEQIQRMFIHGIAVKE